eukprot:CAMPEP_0202443408 /NCGR_PEP_ID=MMETSP1360-20130828/2683_1 /ASSEMBLY_ACC=CAM_ASM_000848 /TAXON_ID=515479 /ORGANISM="Licmophora paradoxa, Strain CCMP2313" /LENGTH=242 /DNA_ID=CAMNT_0049059089 /DNA_START=26 /DNA_END=755 /DNA_ORIENTATION=-
MENEKDYAETKARKIIINQLTSMAESRDPTRPKRSKSKTKRKPTLQSPPLTEDAHEPYAHEFPPLAKETAKPSTSSSLLTKRKFQPALKTVTVTPSKPAPSKPAPSKLTPSKPTPAKLTLSKPTPSKLETKPAAKKPNPIVHSQMFVTASARPAAPTPIPPAPVREIPSPTDSQIPADSHEEPTVSKRPLEPTLLKPPSRRRRNNKTPRKCHDCKSSVLTSDAAITGSLLVVDVEKHTVSGV